MAKEVEYKHIAKYIPENMKDTKKIIYQGYIHIDPKKQVRVRLNQDDRKAWMCVKFMDGNSREEFETEMNYREATELYMLCPWKLSKNRYTFNWGSYHLDLDEYPNGIMTVEIEIRQDSSMFNVDEIRRVHDFIGENVDGQWKYNNYSIAGFPEEKYKED